MDENKITLITSTKEIEKQKDIKNIFKTIKDIEKLLNKYKEDNKIIIENKKEQIDIINIQTRIIKGIEIVKEKLNYYLKPLKEITDGLEMYFGNMIKPLKSFNNDIILGLKDFNKKLEKERRKQEQELAKEKEQKEKEQQEKKLELQIQAESEDDLLEKQRIIDEMNNIENNELPVHKSAVIEQKVETEEVKVHFRDNWKIDIINKEEFIKYAVQNNLFEFIDINISNLNRYAKVVKNNKEIPGIKIYNDPSPVRREK